MGMWWCVLIACAGAPEVPPEAAVGVEIGAAPQVVTREAVLTALRDVATYAESGQQEAAVAAWSEALAGFSVVFEPQLRAERPAAEVAAIEYAFALIHAEIERPRGGAAPARAAALVETLAAVPPPAPAEGG